MGDHPNGPSFRPPPRLGERPVLPPAPSPPLLPPPTGPRHTTIITIAVIAVVALAVIVGSIQAYRSDTQPPVVSPPQTQQSPTPRQVGLTDRVDFSTGDGEGQLRIVSHHWSTSGSEPPEYGHYLEILIEITCTEGAISYTPFDFQTFDEASELHDITTVETHRESLDVGEVTAGQTVRGYLTFDMPRGDVTLMMNDLGNRPVTALRIEN